MISYGVLKPEEVDSENITTKYDKCGADFSEEEYKGAEVVNRIERKTVRMIDNIFLRVLRHL